MIYYHPSILTKILLWCVVSLGLLLAVSQAMFGAPVVTVVNAGPSVVSNVVVSGNAFAEPIGDIAPGESRSVVVYPRGESSLEIAWTVQGAQFKKDDLAYLERHGGYCRRMVLNQDKVTVDAIVSCFSVKRIL